ncbi:hypothetical protein DENSPDRAFT_840687 [Dentipellis sp. KUC8613]|nr:hypothetical protein DENSPDRAFT_840687 [Dentipellis sp. KUC8613]
MSLLMGAPVSTTTPCPLLTRLDHKLLQTIAFFAEDDPSRPPEATRNLRLTCRMLNSILKPENNRCRHVRLFKLKFDFAALHRRLATDMLQPAHYCAELLRRERALHSIRSSRLCEGDTLLVAYTMLLEDEGKNLAQLTAAGLPSLVRRYLCKQRYHGIARGWPSVDKTTALVAALCCQLYIATQDDSLIEDAITDLLMPFAIGTSQVQYPLFHLKLDFPDLPTSRDAFKNKDLHETREGLFLIREYFGHPFLLRIPPVALSATLIFLKHTQKKKLELPSDHLEYPDRVARCQPYRFTKAQIDDFNGRRHLRQLARSPQRSESTSYDADWQRLSPFFGKHRRFIYRLGTLAGEWEGLIRGHDSGSYESLQNGGGWDSSPKAIAEFNAVSSCRPWSCSLSVHYRKIKRSRHISPADEADEFCKRWLPPTCGWRKHEDGIVLLDAQGSISEPYTTYVDGQHSDAMEDVLSSYGPDTDEDDEVDGLDVVLTGKMKEFVGNGWTETLVLGSVRAWDGLIALHRQAVCPYRFSLHSGLIIRHLHLSGSR